MPDRMVEDARNVSINLHGEHGKYVMMQLFFSDKWMLISEITFISSEYKIIFIFRPGHESLKSSFYLISTLIQIQFLYM